MNATRKQQAIVILSAVLIFVLLFLAPRTPSTFESDEDRIDHVIELINTGQAGPPMQAILLLREAAEIDSTNIGLQLQLGHFSMQTNQYEKAVERYTKVIELDVADTTGAQDLLTSAEIALAIWYIEQDGQMEKGLELLSRILIEHPDNPEINFYMGQLLLSMEEYHDALTYLHAVRDNDPQGQFTQVLFMIAETHAVLEEYEMAVFYMERFREKVGTDPELVAGIDRMIEEYLTHLN